MVDGALEEDNSEDELVLPPEVWASVMECKLLLSILLYVIIMYIPLSVILISVTFSTMLILFCYLMVGWIVNYNLQYTI